MDGRLEWKSRGEEEMLIERDLPIRMETASS